MPPDSHLRVRRTCTGHSDSPPQLARSSASAYAYGLLPRNGHDPISVCRHLDIFTDLALRNSTCGTAKPLAPHVRLAPTSDDGASSQQRSVRQVPRLAGPELKVQKLALAR